MQAAWRDLIPLIFEYLTARDLVAAGDVCRFWRKHCDHLFAKNLKLPWTSVPPRVCYKWLCTNQYNLNLDRVSVDHTILAMGFTFPAPKIEQYLWDISPSLQIHRGWSVAELRAQFSISNSNRRDGRAYVISLRDVAHIWQRALDCKRALTLRECLLIVFQPTHRCSESDREFINRFLDGLP
jgi:hypothetical protein